MRAPVTLARPLRAQLENTVKIARDVAEKAARSVLTQMAVAEAKAPDYLSDELKGLRRRLRAHGRALGDAKLSDDTQGLQHLIWEVAYEQWHRMLFARFLAESSLLMWEPGASVSLDDCREMVDNHPDMALGAKSHWELAGKLAARMLPQVFKPNSPVFELAFAPEYQRELERLLAVLSPEVFTASDSLGWVYQFWQSKRKDEVNSSEIKIGADELPAVTQLFTEPYMVDFLLHNSLGAWWMTRHPGKTCPVPLTYLRILEDGTPAAGKFEGWPNALAEFKLLDPCCGSGHFLVAAFLMLVPMRMETEGLSAIDAVNAVLADNLHGLELDARCVEIAVFALALAAWRFTDENGDQVGVRADMPAPHIACCGLKVAAKPEDWMALVPDDAPYAAYLRQELQPLHATFAQAPLLGSLLDPARSLRNDLATSSFDTLRGVLERALATERPATLWGQASEMQDDAWDLAVTARGLLDAARLLDASYHLVVTNVPYLVRNRQTDFLKEFCAAHYSDARQDLANVFLDRCIELTATSGTVQLVMPQNWLFLSSFSKQRQRHLSQHAIHLVARLGAGAFETVGGQVVNVILFTESRKRPLPDHAMRGIDVRNLPAAVDKAKALRESSVVSIQQKSRIQGAHIISFENDTGLKPLQVYADIYEGSSRGDFERFDRFFHELPAIDGSVWSWLVNSPNETAMYSGRELVIEWRNGTGPLAHSDGARIRGKNAWGKKSIFVARTGDFRATLCTGEIHAQNGVAIIPKSNEDLAALWCFVQDAGFKAAIRRVNSKIIVPSGAIFAVPFDADYWRGIAAQEFPAGLPKAFSNDPAQFVFHGHPRPATDPLQVAVARLMGHRWPAETDVLMELADEAHSWIERCKSLAEHSDDDGVVCLPSVRGEQAAHERLFNLLIAAWESVQPGSWKPAVLDKLLADADCAGKGLDVWLRDKFFEQHARLFHHHPFIWQVWDGLKDGFAALVNYHTLDAKKLERLIHTYLGDWIRQQEAGVRDRVDGAQTRLAAAQDLKRRLELILEGDAPYDIFVRWKPLAAQPIGWNPDINDGIRLNIRPFMTAEVLRHNKKPKLNITWDKDRGKDVESAPWFNVFEGDRINDHHLTLAEKKSARVAT